MAHAWISLDGTANTRDLGGLPTDDGRVTRPGVLLRSDNLQELSAADVERLQALPVGVVVDLRTPGEIAADGPSPLDAAGVLRVALTLIPDAAVSDGRLLPERWETRIATVYENYLRDEPANVVAAVRAIATADGAALVHCAAGKDRTGTIVALALSAVGVPDELVVADYAATAEVIEPLIARLMRSPTYHDHTSRRPVSEHTPVASTMAAFLQWLQAEYGGAAAWLTSHGLSESDLLRLRARLVG